MGRKKAKLQWITNESRRRAVFNKRCEDLFKKARELAILCNVKVCVVVYGENEAQPRVWPSVPEAIDMITSYKAMEESEQQKKAMTCEEYLCNSITKLKEYVAKSDRESRDRDILILLFECLGGRRPGLMGICDEDLSDLRVMAERMQNRILEHLQNLGVSQITLDPIALL